ncbi:transcriptional regulator, TetR family [Klenkia terrae]|uniref:TetR/AcrR family transcriptional regulator n=1 Tax=Klenkia terrae TaxID=1052259 RepID=UPI001751E3B5|nr:TetR/AcrR family transcriptional regulator [Klenkia terrae]SSC23717.1 transcriptional regulator, TetR family [Klenkia terrae]
MVAAVSRAHTRRRFTVHARSPHSFDGGGVLTDTSWRDRKRDRTRQQIVLAARHLFLTQGFDRTTVQQIAEAADVAVQTLFNHAASKEALFFLDRVPFADALTRPAEAGEESWDQTLVAHLTELSIGYMRSLDDPGNLAMATQIEATPSLHRHERSLHNQVEGELAEVIAAHLPDADARLGAAVLLATTRVHAHTYRQHLIAGAVPPLCLDQLAEVLPVRLAHVFAVARHAQPAPHPAPAR